MFVSIKKYRRALRRIIDVENANETLTQTIDQLRSKIMQELPFSYIYDPNTDTRNVVDKKTGHIYMYDKNKNEL